jgi:hypothetical protein
MTVSREAVGELGSGGMVEQIESLINVVIVDRLKQLTGLNQNGARLANLLVIQVTRTRMPLAERRHLNHPWLYSQIC